MLSLLKAGVFASYCGMNIICAEFLYLQLEKRLKKKKNMQMLRIYFVCMKTTWFSCFVFLHQSSTSPFPPSQNKMYSLQYSSLRSRFGFLWTITLAVLRERERERETERERGGSCILCPSLSTSDVRAEVSSTICEAVITLPFYSTARRQRAGPGVLCTGAVHLYTLKPPNLHSEAPHTHKYTHTCKINK